MIFSAVFLEEMRLNDLDIVRRSPVGKKQLLHEISARNAAFLGEILVSVRVKRDKVLESLKDMCQIMIISRGYIGKISGSGEG